MKNKILINFFSSGLQAVAVQIFGGVFFYITSIYLSKYDFGLINWSNAIAVTITLFLSFGFEQMVIRRIAASHQSSWIASIYFFHNLLSSLAAIVILFFIGFFSNHKSDFYLLPWMFLSQSLIFIATPFKHLLNAKENFTPYAVIAFLSNTLKIILILLCKFLYGISINAVVSVLILCSLLEFIAIFIYIRRKEKIKFIYKKRAYLSLIKISSPQYIAILFDAILGRIDWIILGISSTKIASADYSFTYKMYELSRLPVFIIAPIILPKFTRIAESKQVSDDKKIDLHNLFVIEMFIAILLPLCLNIVWGPFIDAVTENKYGRTNAYCFFILSLCITLHFMINYMWTAFIALKRFKLISIALGISAIANLVLNLVFIPKYSIIGAAYAYLIAIALQTAIFIFYIQKTDFKVSLKPLVLFIIFAVITYFISVRITTSTPLQLFLSIFIYFTLCIVSGQIRFSNLAWVKSYISR